MHVEYNVKKTDTDVAEIPHFMRFIYVILESGSGVQWVRRKSYGSHFSGGGGGASYVK
jgi:hypothetical protein